MLSLYKSNEFQQDYNRYQTVIKNHKSEKAKESAEKLLTELVNEVKKLDAYHNEMVNFGQPVNGLDDFKYNITRIRKSLNTVLSIDR